MLFLDLTATSLEENLALDEAFLNAAENGRLEDGLLRVWEWATPAVVVGRASRLAQEVQLDRCQKRGVPVVRRCSGGAAVVIGPGCLLYTLILPLSPDIPRHMERIHASVLNPIAAALAARAPGVVRAGISDLARCQPPRQSTATSDCNPRDPESPVPSAPRKFSGNSLRCRRQWLLYHGTILYRFDLSLVEELLSMPPRQPDYRGDRRHGDFLCNLPLDRDTLCLALRTAWGAWEPAGDIPQQELQDLLARYRDPAWNLDH